MEDILLVHRKSSKNFCESLDGAAIWKTCLRKILFCTEEELKVYQKFLTKEDHILRGENALSLLLEILCGLHSPIVGETEVLGQFKAFVESRKTLQDPLFADHRKWLNFITTEVKKARAEHLVGIGSHSYGSLLRKYTKDLNTVTLCGSGQLAQELLPWMMDKKTLQMLCRDPNKLHDIQNSYNNLIVKKYSETGYQTEVLIIAAPLSDTLIHSLLSQQLGSCAAVFDLRGEENNLANIISEQFPQINYLGLQQFFKDIEDVKKEAHTKIQNLKVKLYDRAVSFMHRCELRPLGWDDLCA